VVTAPLFVVSFCVLFGASPSLTTDKEVHVCMYALVWVPTTEAISDHSNNPLAPAGSQVEQCKGNILHPCLACTATAARCSNSHNDKQCTPRAPSFVHDNNKKLLCHLAVVLSMSKPTVRPHLRISHQEPLFRSCMLMLMLMQVLKEVLSYILAWSLLGLL